jgi:hypothetical protein
MLSPELIAAAQSLETRFDILNIQTKRVPQSDWSVVPSEVMSLLPLWLPELLDRFRLAEGTLVCRNHRRARGLDTAFKFYRPRDYLAASQSILGEEPLLKEEVIDVGLVPLCNAEDGDYWVTTIRGDCDSPVYYHSLTDLDNFHASRNIAHLLAGAAVSDYYGEHPQSHSMWDLSDAYASRQAAQRLFPRDPAIYDELIDIAERMKDPKKVRTWRDEKKKHCA